MAFQIKYARLFECRLWHGYYLHQGNRQNFHNLDINNTADLISIQNILSRYDVKKIFDIKPFKETTKIMAGRKMKIAYDNTGFFVGISVKPTADPRFYEPTLPFNDTLKLQFGLRLANPAFFAQVTNERMRTNVPAIYYFTNLMANDGDYADANLTLRTISQQYPIYQNRRYEMGELIHDGTDLFRSFVADTSGVGLTDPTVWEPEDPGGPENNFENRFEVNESDRVLLPSVFNYTFTPRDGVSITDATVILKDLQGNPIQTDILSLSAGQLEIPLKYSDLDNGWYRLEVEDVSGDYATSQLVYLNDELYDRNLWGVIEIGHDDALSAANSNRRILETDGSLRHTAIETETPIFNLRIPNRYTYWRYKMHPTQALVPNAGSGLDLVPNTDLIVTSSHLPNTQFGIQIQYTDITGSAFLPSPVVTVCRPETDGRIYSDVHLGILPI